MNLINKFENEKSVLRLNYIDHVNNLMCYESTCQDTIDKMANFGLESKLRDLYEKYDNLAEERFNKILSKEPSAKGETQDKKPKSKKK